MTLHIIGSLGLLGKTLLHYAQQAEKVTTTDELGADQSGESRKSPRAKIKNDPHLEDISSVRAYHSPTISLLAEQEHTFSALKLTPGDTVINCVGYTAVDKAETEPGLCYQLNAYGPAALAHYVHNHHSRYISISSDYVFSHPLTPADIPQAKPWTPHDPTYIQCVYGDSKLRGEDQIRANNPDAIIVRTAWLYTTPTWLYTSPSKHLPAKADLVNLMTHKALNQQRVRMVADQVGSPTLVDHLALGLLSLSKSNLPGQILHYSGAGQGSWYDLTREIYHQLGADLNLIEPITTAELARSARRPAYSALDTSQWNKYQLYPSQDWKKTLAHALSYHRPQR